MSNYTGLAQFRFLLLGSALLSTAYSADETYRIRVPANSATSTEMAAARTDTTLDSKPAPKLRNLATKRYVVKKGDTLWSISKHFLQRPWQWPEIWYGNGQVKNPHHIYPGMILNLLMIDGRPQLVIDKLSPQVRESRLDSAVPAIPLEAIRDFLGAPRLISKDELEGTPYILEFVDNHIVAGAGNQVFVKDLTRRQGTIYNVVHLGDAYINPDDGEVMGYEGAPVGTAEVIQRENGRCGNVASEVREYEVDVPNNARNEKTLHAPTSTTVRRTEIRRNPAPDCDESGIGMATLITTTREARIGDHFLPQERGIIDPYFYPRAPEKETRGSIISVFDGASQIGQYQIVALNRGANDGLAPGHVLTVMQSGREARDPESWFGRTIKLPETEAGTVMVFKVTPHLSYALVMEATRAIHALDSVVSPH